MAADGDFTYKDAGVDVAAGNEAVRLLKERVRSIHHPLVLEGIGGFGGLMRVPPIKDAVLVAGTDGAGTKVILAREMGVYGTIGIDAVAMSVNDVSACGAVPLFFLDYLVVGKVEPQRVADIVAGVDEGCLLAQCVLLGGETAEHPGHFADDGAFDLAGFAVGIAGRSELWGPARVEPGDVLVGIASNGLHSNGFSLVRALLAERHIALDEPFPFAGSAGADADPGAPKAGGSPGGGAASGGAASVESPGRGGASRQAATQQTVGEVLLTPTTIYSPVLHDLGHACPVHAAAHITGGGFPDNVGRILPDGAAAVLDLSAWRPPAVFSWLHARGVALDEMLSTFNCGLGMVVALPAESVPRALATIAQAGLPATVVGKVIGGEPGARRVRYKGELAL
jgi:phosphoribosylformylglycinamidine cyclo-ligase